MKIFANKEIKKSVSCSITGYLGLAFLLLTQGFSMVVHISGFLCCSYCLFSYWQEELILAVGYSIFQKAKSSHGTGGITDQCVS